MLEGIHVEIAVSFQTSDFMPLQKHHNGWTTTVLSFTVMSITWGPSAFCCFYLWLSLRSNPFLAHPKDVAVIADPHSLCARNGYGLPSVVGNILDHRVIQNCSQKLKKKRKTDHSKTELSIHFY